MATGYIYMPAAPLRNELGSEHIEGARNRSSGRTPAPCGKTQAVSHSRDTDAHRLPVDLARLVCVLHRDEHADDHARLAGASTGERLSVRAHLGDGVVRRSDGYCLASWRRALRQGAEEVPHIRQSAGQCRAHPHRGHDGRHRHTSGSAR